MITAICGKACAGKNAVAALLAEAGFFIIDADALGQEALRAQPAQYAGAFGAQILDAEGRVNRKALGALVFADKKKLEQLNALSAPYIIGGIEKLCAARKGQNIAINAALAPYWPLAMVDSLIWVEAPLLIRLLRALKRDKRGLLFALKRIWMQRKLSPKLFYRPVDIYKVRNCGSQQSLRKKVLKIIQLKTSKGVRN